MAKKREEYRTITSEYLEQDKLNRREHSRTRAAVSYAEKMHREAPGSYGGAEREGDPSDPHLNRKAYGLESFILWLKGD